MKLRDLFWTDYSIEGKHLVPFSGTWEYEKKADLYLKEHNIDPRRAPAKTELRNTALIIYSIAAPVVGLELILSIK